MYRWEYSVLLTYDKQTGLGQGTAPQAHRISGPTQQERLGLSRLIFQSHPEHVEIYRG